MRTPGAHPEEKGERGLKYPSQWSMEDRVSLKGFHMGLSCIYPRIGILKLAQKVLPVCYFFGMLRLGTKYAGNCIFRLVTDRRLG